MDAAMRSPCSPIASCDGEPTITGRRRFSTGGPGTQEAAARRGGDSALLGRQPRGSADRDVRRAVGVELSEHQSYGPDDEVVVLVDGVLVGVDLPPVHS
jgi:hypothetical protein